MNKIEALQALLVRLEQGKLTDVEMKTLRFNDENGNSVRLSDPNAAALLRDRISKEPQ